MNKKKLFIFIIVSIVIIVLAVLAFFLSPKPVEENNIAKVEKDVYIGSGSIDWAPVSSEKEGNLVGVGPALAAMIMNDLGLKTEYKPTSAMTDFFVAARFGNNELEYSKSYIKEEVMVFTKSDKTFTFETLTDLQGKKGIVLSDMSYGQKIDEFVGNNSDVIKLNSAVLAFAALDNNQADYFLYTKYAAARFLLADDYRNKYAMLAEPVTLSSFYFAFPKNSPLLKYLPEINNLIDKYEANGTIMQLIMANEAR